MKFSWQDTMTDAQLAVIGQLRNDVNDLLNLFIARRDAAIAAYAKLPCTNERGTAVVFGANKNMLRAVDTYQTMIDELATYADDRGAPGLRRPRGV